eukprot:11007595-Lingulodinium_polyedra.AAC.1
MAHRNQRWHLGLAATGSPEWGTRHPVLRRHSALLSTNHWAAARPSKGPRFHCYPPAITSSTCARN